MKTELVHRRFKFPPRCDCGEMVMRETNGVDEQRAALQADARGERSSIYQELVRLSVVEVDGVKVQQPFAALEGWNSRTRALVQSAYQSLNDIKEEEMGAFLGSGEDATPNASVRPREEMPEPAPESRSKITAK